MTWSIWLVLILKFTHTQKKRVSEKKERQTDRDKEIQRLREKDTNREIQREREEEGKK